MELNLNNIKLFVHVYHVWAAFGLITFGLFLPQAWRGWKSGGGKILYAPCEILRLVGFVVVATIRDWLRIPLLVIHVIRGDRYVWPHTPNPVWKYETAQTLRLGIMFGGMSRFLTALYWSEKNVAWMTDANVFIPGLLVAIAIVADALHQVTAWPNSPHRTRIVPFAIQVGG